MTGKSFYELDYMIEINEQRLGEYSAACEKVMDRLTNIIVIYSAMAIFLVPIVKDFLATGKKDWWLNGCFVLFVVLFAISVCYTIRLIIPVNLLTLTEPKLYYGDCRMEYEGVVNNRMSIEVLLKASYIRELEDSLNSNIIIYTRKTSYYNHALICVLLSIIPYLICLGDHISNQEKDKEPKTEIII